MLSINMIQTSLFIIAITLLVTVSSKHIASPDVCLSNLDCPPTTFCKGRISREVPSCVPRLPENAACNELGLKECQEGLTCIFNDSKRADGPTCQRRGPRGSPCSLDATRPCVDDLICDRNTTTCQPFTDGFEGTPCETDRHCQLEKGFYCPKYIDLCSPRKGPGRECDVQFTSDPFECQGFCVSERFSYGSCIRASKEGELCAGDGHCDNRNSAGDPLLCNRPTGTVGRCTRYSRLINRLGAKCHPAYDRCDSRRGLSCRPTRRGKYVCQHLDSQFCKPRSRLSHCTWRDEKQECRLFRHVPGKPRYRSSLFYECRRKSERVSRGGVCVTEYAVCERGTQCRVVPGVRPHRGPLYSVFTPPRVSYCVRIVQEHGFCGDVKDKFTTQCAEGLRCEKGKCVKAEKNELPFNDTVTHIGLGVLCSDLPCAPGLVCDNTESDRSKRCILPLRVVGRGTPCTDRAVERRRCKDGLVCARKRDGTNVKRCRKPRKAGDYCQQSDECADGLICPEAWTPNREREERRCYDPKTTLNIGDKCDPRAIASQPRCVENEQADITAAGHFFFEPMRCVAKGDGFACRVIRNLFRFCSETGDKTCDVGQKCGDVGVCIPAGETSH